MGRGIDTQRCGWRPEKPKEWTWAEAIQEPGIYREGDGTGRLVVFEPGHFFWWAISSIYRPNHDSNFRLTRTDESLIVDVK